ncbi:MAG: sterol desaturase family protein [Pseudomonadota bacterium]
MSAEFFFLFFVSVATIFATEAFAWVTHKYLMHGPLWFIHKTHHEPRTGPFELNDVFGIVFSLPSMALIYVGWKSNPVALAIGLGILAYGCIYFFYHDWLVHGRGPFPIRPKKGYLARIVQAHRLHHAVEAKEDCVSFGFIFAPSPRRLKKLLAATDRAKLRAASRRAQTSASATQASLNKRKAPVSVSG